jgi:hypothetical protein
MMPAPDRVDARLIFDGKGRLTRHGTVGVRSAAFTFWACFVGKWTLSVQVAHPVPVKQRLIEAARTENALLRIAPIAWLNGFLVIWIEPREATERVCLPP